MIAITASAAIVPPINHQLIGVGVGAADTSQRQASSVCTIVVWVSSLTAIQNSQFSGAVASSGISTAISTSLVSLGASTGAGSAIITQA